LIDKIPLTMLQAYGILRKRIGPEESTSRVSPGAVGFKLFRSFWSEDGKSIPPEEIIAFCSERIAKFKVPRYIEYRESFPRTPTERVEKHKLVAEKKDLRSGCYDAEEKGWLG